MRILCTKKELAILVRLCECNIKTNCNGCLFCGLCSAPNDDKGVVSGVEDFCEIVTEE